jgi:RNA-directed DNA polymerase
VVYRSGVENRHGAPSTHSRRGSASPAEHHVHDEIFTQLDNDMWRLAYKWAKHSHPNKPRCWIVNRYFGAFNKARQDRWVFGDRDSGAYLLKFAWTKIVRHQLVNGAASPDDPALADYWANRRRKGPPPPVDATTLRLLRSQHGRCPLCRCPLLPADQPPQSPNEWERWLNTTRKTISSQRIVITGHGKPDALRFRLIHTTCQRRHSAADKHSSPTPNSDGQGLA